MSYLRTCNPYFVKSLHLGTSTGGQTEDVSMSALQTFLKQNNIDPNFANVLSKVSVHNMQELQSFLEKIFTIVAKNPWRSTQSNFSQTIPMSNRVPISNVSPFENYLWNEIVSKETTQQNQIDAKKFLKIAYNIIYSDYKNLRRITEEWDN